MTKAESITETYLSSTRTGWQIVYEPMTIHLGDQTYKPDFVCFSPRGERQYIEVKNASEDSKWQGFRIRETRVKLAFLRHVARDFGHRVFLVTVKAGRVSKETEIMP